MVKSKIAFSAFATFKSPSAVTIAIAVFSVVEAANAFSKAAADSLVRIETKVLAAASARLSFVKQFATAEIAELSAHWRSKRKAKT
ncbi:hypothetical protein D3C73_907080 [compost metagenome]